MLAPTENPSVKQPNNNAIMLITLIVFIFRSFVYVFFIFDLASTTIGFMYPFVANIVLFAQSANTTSQIDYE